MEVGYAVDWAELKEAIGNSIFEILAPEVEDSMEI
jgi:hypothetical protein